MSLPERKGSDLPIVFLGLLLVFISGYTGLMFYIEGKFGASLVSYGISLVLAWFVLDRSVF